eukprot:286918-Hanusia_phi.AAC.1
MNRCVYPRLAALRRDRAPRIEWLQGVVSLTVFYKMGPGYGTGYGTGKMNDDRRPYGSARRLSGILRLRRDTVPHPPGARANKRP